MRIGLERCVAEILQKGIDIQTKPEPVVCRLMKDHLGFQLLITGLSELEENIKELELSNSTDL